MAFPETVAERPATATRPAETRRASYLEPAAWGPLVARIALGFIMLMHGLQKLGLFGGAGWSATIGYFHSQLSIPEPLAALVILTEAVGGACLLIGLASRFAALAVLIEMSVAAIMVHVPNGFFLNWQMTPGRGHGFEMNLALVGLAAVVILEGGGRWALDQLIVRRLARSER